MVSIGLSAQQMPARAQTADTELRIHPNPALGSTVQIVTADTSPKTVLIFDLFGKVVLRRRISSNSLNIESLVPGVYMVRVLQSGKSATKKLVIR
jgi:hypothetical protein